MANVIIGIHGLGNKPSKQLLERWWKRAMIEGLWKNNFKPRLPKFEMVYWADIIYDKPLDLHEKNKQNPYFLEEKYIKGKKDFPIENHDSKIKLFDFIGRQLNRIFLNEDFSLNYSYITDTLISKYFKELELYYSEKCNYVGDNSPKIKDLIRERLFKTLKKYKNDDIMLISHSMGSIVAFDVLTFLAPQIEVNTFVTMGSPLGLPIVISKIAAEQKQKLNGENHMVTPPAIMKSWYNFSDILDKVAFNFKLADDFSENNIGIKPIDFLVTNNYEINEERNPHKSFGYLRTSEFSNILNKYLLAEKISLLQKVIRKTTQIIRNVKSRVAIQTTKKLNKRRRFLIRTSKK